MSTIFEELRADHDPQRALLDQLIDTSGDEPLRRQVYADLKAQLEAHAAAEEEHFYTVLMTDDQTREKARHSVAEHKEMDDHLEALDEIAMDSPQWLTKAKQMADRVRHHLEEEEEEVFPVAGRVFEAADKDNAGDGYRLDMVERV